MVTATFRFYEELGDFLPPARRRQSFASPCAQAATAKHMIEALGVPHTEVELVVVNGEPSLFDRLLADGDRVAVYPRFATLDLGALPQLREEAPRRFVADAHLGGLARLLRMAGFDTLYDNNFSDDEIERIAGDDGRLVLTRDRELLKRRTIVHGRYVHTLRPAAQLVEVVERLRLETSAAPFTLCLHCNAPLRSVDKAAVLKQLPAMVQACHDEFRTCDVCHRVYWKGSHWRRMNALLEASIGGLTPVLPSAVGTPFQRTRPGQ